MQTAKWLFLSLCLGLAACEQAQLTGPIGGGEVNVTELRSSLNVLSGVSTSDADSLAAFVGDEAFASFNSLQVATLVGINTLSNADFDPDTWYVMSVQGGFDYDADGNRLADQAPVQVFGTVHALLTGAELNSRRFSITPVTEAAYRFALEIVTETPDEDLRARLDAVAADLVDDVTGDGAIDYTDVLTWNRLRNTRQLRADIDALTSALAGGESDAAITSAALALLPSADTQVDAETYFAQTASSVVQGRCGSCHRQGGVGARGSSYILQPTSNRNHVSENTDMFRALVRRRGVDYILDKSIGQRRHGGGNRLGRLPEDFAVLETLLNLIESEG